MSLKSIRPFVSLKSALTYNMSISTDTPSTTDIAPTLGSSLLPYIRNVLEGLWILAAFLVPLIFVNQNYVISEAQIAYVEVPKVALLRTLASLIILFWSLEWAITSQAFQGKFPSISRQGIYGKAWASKLVSEPLNWLKVHPTRWLLLAAGIFFGATFVSTVLSGSVANSMWGEIPGQDGYSAYTIASYCAIFGVIATHIKTRAQLGRLLGTMILMGFLVGLYAIFQHYGHDFLGLTEISGGGTARVTTFMGNAIFVAALLTMTIPLTLVVAAINFRDENWGNWAPVSHLGQLGRDSLFTLAWASILAIQLLGLTFTLTRGAWTATVFALLIFLVIVVISLGFRMLIRVILVLGLSGIFVLALLYSLDSVSVFNLGSWFGFVIALSGLAGTFVVLYVIKKLSRLIVFISASVAVITIVGASVLAMSALPGLGSSDSISGVESTTDQIVGRITSLETAVRSGAIGGRTKHWEISWELIKDRPWFGFDDLHLTSLRPLIGYGPDLFRYTYLLKSPPEDPGGGLPSPLEPDHAHNFFIHQTVEQGFLGGFASIALFASVFGVGCHHLLFRRRNADPLYRLLLFGLVAIILGRFLEMMVGVARISDLTILWILFGLFAALVRFDNDRQEETLSIANPFTEPTSRRNRRRAVKTSPTPSFSNALIFRLAIVAWLVGGIGVITWQKNINSVRASIAEGHAIKHFREGDIESSVKDLDKAIKLAPGIPDYYGNRAKVSMAYQIRSETVTEPICGQQVENPYLTCLGLQALNFNLESVNQQPFNFRARISAAYSAWNLHLTDSASDMFEIATNMVPNSHAIRNDLAEVQIAIGLYEKALEELNQSLSITGESPDSARALHLKGKIFWETGRYNDAVNALKHSIALETSTQALHLLHDIYTMQGVINDIGYFDELINENPKDAVAFYFRGIAELEDGNKNNATSDLETASRLGVSTVDVGQAFRLGVDPFDFIQEETRKDLSIKAASDARFALSYYANIKPDDERYESALMIIGQNYLDLGSWKEAVDSFTESVSISPDNSAGYRNRGAALFALMRYQEAIRDYEQAVALNPVDSVNYIALGKVYAALEEFETARLHFNRSIQLDPKSSDAYAARGFLSVRVEDYSMGLLDIEQAIELSATNHDAYFKKSQAHTGLNQASLALDNLSKAITLAPINADYFYSRGLLKSQLNEYEKAITDFTVAIELNKVMANENPQYAKPYIGRGIAHVKTGYPGNALEDAQNALKLLEGFNTPEWHYYKPTINFQRANVHKLLGDSYTALGKPEEAQNEYEQSSSYR